MKIGKNYMKENKNINPLISIIAPMYKIPKEYLLECFTSVVNQTYLNWEFIVVDDGSPDDSGLYCDELAKKDNRIKVIHQKNMGVSVARNTGIEHSNGDYIAFIDSDDWIDANYLQVFVDRLKNVDYDICICNAIVERKNKKENNDFFNNDSIKCNDDEKYQLQSQLVCRGLTSYHPPYVNVGVPWGKIYKKSFIMKNNIKFKPGVKRMQDNLFNLYAFKNANCISCINQRTYHYREFSESAVNKYNPDIISDFKPFLDELDKFVVNEKNDIWIYGANKRKITSINSYMSSYFFHKKNKNNFIKKIKELKKYLKQDDIRNSVNNTNKSIMNIQEKIFYIFVKYKFAFGLYLLFTLKNKVNI